MFPSEWLHKVTAVTTTTKTDDYGNSTTATVNKTVREVLYAPEGITESVGAPVIGDASLYGPFPLLDADDTVTHASSCGCGGKMFPLGSWQVVGGSKPWPLGSVVPIRRTSAA